MGCAYYPALEFQRQPPLIKSIGTIALIWNLGFTDPGERGPFCSPPLALFFSLLCWCMNVERFSAGLASGVGRRLIRPIQGDMKGQQI